jgi:hypothetical protein
MGVHTQIDIGIVFEMAVIASKTFTLISVISKYFIRT